VPVAASERRSKSNRRSGRDRRDPSGSIDVTRIEHENLYAQVEKLLLSLHRIERKLHDHETRMANIEKLAKPSRRASA
jgi:hypothetical protein